MKISNESKDFITSRIKMYFQPLAWILDLFKPSDYKAKYKSLLKANRNLVNSNNNITDRCKIILDASKKLEKSNKTLLLGNRILNFNYEELDKEVFSLKQKCANLKNQNTELFKTLEEVRKENYVKGEVK